MAEWKGVHYNDGDMLHMQQEAIRRVRQMQQRAARTVGQVEDVDYVEVPDHPARQPFQDAPAGAAPAAAASGHASFVPPRGAPHRAPHPANASHTAHPPQSGNILSQLGNSLGLGSIGEKLSGLGEKLGLGGASSQEEDAPGGPSNFITSLVGEDSPIAKVFSALNIDNERLILIGLLLILLNEKGDKTLLIALVYLLL